VRVLEEPVYVTQRPVIHEKTTIIERPIITEKVIIEREINITKEMPQHHERSFHQVAQPVTIRENPTVTRDEINSNFENLKLEGEPIITRQTEVLREEPLYYKDKTDMYVKEVVHEKPIIHERDILYLEKPVYHETHEIRERPVHRTEAPNVITEQTVRREVRMEDLTIPDESNANVQRQRVVVQEVPIFVKEKSEIYEKEVLVEKPVIHEQPLIFTDKQEIREKPEFIEKRGYQVEQGYVERGDPIYLRSDDNVSLSNVREGDTINQQKNSGKNYSKPMSDVA